MFILIVIFVMFICFVNFCNCNKIVNHKCVYVFMRMSLSAKVDNDIDDD